MSVPSSGRFWSILMSGLLFASGAARAQELVINEIMAAGQGVIADEDGGFPDWIEIANPGAAEINTAGWHLTDNVAQLSKWTFPARTIPPGGYMVVFASGRDRAAATGPLHTNFSLKSSGESLALVAPNGTVVSSVTYPVQLPDVSYEPAGQRFFGEPTPNAANSTAPLAVAMAPSFSQAHGFQEKPFLLTLATSTSGGVIRFTMDGSEPTETNGRAYAGPIPIKQTTVVRAATFSNGLQPSTSVTRTYLFIGDVVTQSLDGKRPPGWPKSWGMNRVDYGLDPRIVQRPPYKKTIKDDLRTIPSLSIVTDLKNLFDPEKGIYANAQNKGDEWERPMSIELINPDGTPGFQVNAGLRIRGGASRDSGNPKHSFRVLLRKEYGAPTLEYPLFGPTGAQSTSRFDIRCEQLIAWHYFVDPNADFMRDIYGRDTQGALGQPYKRGDFHHLYINGQYWGLYQTDERVSADYASQYFGGDEEDYDVVKFDAESSGGSGFTDGTYGSWRRLFEAGKRGFAHNEDYFQVQGQNPDGSRNRSYERLLDVDNVIDYMLAGIFICADDSPPAFGTQNNWYSVRSRKGDFGFRFFAHDWEISMQDATENRVGEAPTVSPFDEGLLDPGSANPWHYWQALRLNAEFRLRVADHVQKFMFNGGPLTVEAARARWQRRMDEIDRAVVGESARWGDARPGGIQTFATPTELAAAWLAKQLGQEPATAEDVIIEPGPDPIPRPGPGPKPGPTKKPKPFTRDDWYAAANGRVLNGFLTVRTDAMLQHLKDGGLFPPLAAPGIQPYGGALPVGATVTMIPPSDDSAEVYYTTDGTDPRRVGGAVSATAQRYGASFALARQTTVKARAKLGSEWSALVEVEFTPGVDYRPLRITEILYNAPDAGGVPEKDYEFLELQNTGTVALDLSGAKFTAGIDYTFPTGTVLPAGSRYVLARNAAAFETKYPGVSPQGFYLGRLNDDGEALTLATESGARIFSVTYKDQLPWPLVADGLGFSLVRASDGDPDDPKSWRASAAPGGSPGADDPAGPVSPKVVINEILTRPTGGASAAVELQNLDTVTADLSGWWLSTDAMNPRQYKLPAGTTVPPGGYLVITEAQFSPAMGLSKTGGAIYLFAANSADALTGYAHGFTYAATPEGVSFGRHVNSAGEEFFPPQSATTIGSENAGPAVPNLRISELNYFPPAGVEEFVELENRTLANVSLTGASLGGVNFVFPADAVLPAHGRALVVMTQPGVFREMYKVPAEVPIYGPALGSLQNDGERVELRMPIVIDGTPTQYVVDSVRYNDKRPWPTGAAGFGASLQRLASGTYGDEPQNWVAGQPSPGDANKVNAPPRIKLTSPIDGTVLIPPRTANFAVDVSDPDGTMRKVEFLVDDVVIGQDDSAPFTFVWRPARGLHDLSARAIDDGGASTLSNIVTVDVDAPDSGAGQGLHGEYYANADFSGEPTLRNDSVIRFDWAERPPFAGFPQAGYSVRWTGKILPRTTGDHTLLLRASGGVRLFINNELVVDAPDESSTVGLAEFPAVIAFSAGELVDLRLEYTERDGFGGVELLWGEPGQFDATTLAQTQLYLPDQDPDALGIASEGEIRARVVGREFRTQLQGLNGMRPYAWSVGSGQIPPGVTLSERGVLSGTPTVVGIYRFIVQVRDAAGAEATRDFSLQVTDPSPGRLAPSIQILKPGNGARFGDEPITLTGTAVAPRGLAELRYSINQGPWHSFSAQPRWELVLNAIRGLQPGANIVRVISIDQDGRESKTATRSFTREVLAPLTVTVEGEGTVTASFVGTTQRVLGKSYQIVAKPKPGFVLQEWRGIFTSDPTLRFTMSEGLELTAVFVPNPFATIAGTYTTLLQGETPDHHTRGVAQLNLTSRGAFTGKLAFAGRTHRIRGAFSSTGFSYVEVLNVGGNFLGLSLQFNFETGEMDVRAGLSEDSRYYEGAGLAIRADYDVTNAPCAFAGRYLITLTPQADPVAVAPESQTATLVIDSNGKARFTGNLVDGSRWNGRSFVRRDGVLPLYAGLYRGSGSISGDATFTLTPDRGGSGALFVSKPAADGGTEPETETLQATVTPVPTAAAK